MMMRGRRTYEMTLYLLTDMTVSGYINESCIRLRLGGPSRASDLAKIYSKGTLLGSNKTSSFELRGDSIPEILTETTNA